MPGTTPRHEQPLVLQSAGQSLSKTDASSAEQRRVRPASAAGQQRQVTTTGWSSPSLQRCRGPEATGPAPKSSHQSSLAGAQDHAAFGRPDFGCLPSAKQILGNILPDARVKHIRYSQNQLHVRSANV